jgi:hypothetical protein
MCPIRPVLCLESTFLVSYSIGVSEAYNMLIINLEHVSCQAVGRSWMEDEGLEMSM